jgi:hypothetical protein
MCVLMRRGYAADEINYPDNGCSASPSCLQCPLPQCRYDVPGGLQTLRAVKRRAEVEALRAEGLTAPEVAARLGISARVVYRIGERDFGRRTR